MAAIATLSTKEVAALAGASERMVRDEIAGGIVTPVETARGRAPRRTFDHRAVYYFTLLRRLSLPLPAGDRRDLYRVLTEDLAACGRWTRTGGKLRHADLAAIDTAPARAEFEKRLSLYRRGLERIESRGDVLGGEPVFKGTRLAVRHIGGMVRKGVSPQDIHADYPSLSNDDIAFAAIYARLKPPPGGPKKPLRFVRADSA